MQFRTPGVPEAIVIAFLTSLPTLMQNYASLQQAQDRIASQLKFEYIFNITEEFDYIIVGGGSAGGVVANRLSANILNRVLLLEIGGDPNKYEQYPSLYSALWGQPPIFNMYKTQTRTNVCLNSNKSCSVPTGRGLGGGSAVNGMIYLRGSPKDVNEWASITGDPAWSYANVVETFKKSEDYHGYFEENPGNNHGKNGELYVGKEVDSEFKELFFEAAHDQGMQLRDFNSDFSSGYGPIDFNIKRGARFQVYDAFIKPSLLRPNLKIYRYSQAVKIHLDSNRRAYAVTYVRHGVTRYVRSRKEVIVSAGAIESAKLLMLSGIGPKAHLESVGVTPLVDLPVGQNFQDQVAASYVTFSINETLSYSPRRDLKVNDVTNYFVRGEGPLGVLDFNPSAVIYTNSSAATADYPDIEIIFKARYEAANINYTLDRFSLVPILLRPDSVGSVELASNNYKDAAKVNPNYLGIASDANRLLEAVLFSVNFIENSEIFQSLNATLVPNSPIAGCEGFEFKSSEYWDCFIRHQNMAVYHLFGSNRMGRAGDPKTVVDSKLRVFNTKGLRVIDDSVIPGTISGHTNAAAIMIGEMGSSFILNG